VCSGIDADSEEDGAVVASSGSAVATAGAVGRAISFAFHLLVFRHRLEKRLGDYKGGLVPGSRLISRLYGRCGGRVSAADCEEAPSRSRYWEGTVLRSAAKYSAESQALGEGRISVIPPSVADDSKQAEKGSMLLGSNVEKESEYTCRPSSSASLQRLS